MHRRLFWLLKNDKIVLAHYLVTEVDYKTEGGTDVPLGSVATPVRRAGATIALESPP